MSFQQHFNNASNQHRKRLSSFKKSLTTPWNLTLIIIWSSLVAKMSTVCWCASEVWRNGTSSHSRTDSDDHSAFYFLQLNKDHKTYPTSQRPLLLQHKTQWESKEGVKERDPEDEWTKNDTDATVCNVEFTLITSILQPYRYIVLPILSADMSMSQIYRYCRIWRRYELFFFFLQNI